MTRSKVASGKGRRRASPRTAPRRRAGRPRRAHQGGEQRRRPLQLGRGRGQRPPRGAATGGLEGVAAAAAAEVEHAVAGRAARAGRSRRSARRPLHDAVGAGSRRIDGRGSRRRGARRARCSPGDALAARRCAGRPAPGRRAGGRARVVQQAEDRRASAPASPGGTRARCRRRRPRPRAGRRRWWRRAGRRRPWPRRPAARSPRTATARRRPRPRRTARRCRSSLDARDERDGGVEARGGRGRRGWPSPRRGLADDDELDVGPLGAQLGDRLEQWHEALHRHVGRRWCVMMRPGTRATLGERPELSGSTPTGTTAAGRGRRRIWATMSRCGRLRHGDDPRELRGAPASASRVKPYQRRSVSLRSGSSAWARSSSRSTVIGWWSVASTGQPSSTMPAARAEALVVVHDVEVVAAGGAGARRARRLNVRGSGNPAVHISPNSRQVDRVAVLPGPQRQPERVGLGGTGRGSGSRHELDPSVELRVGRAGRRPSTWWPRSTSALAEVAGVHALAAGVRVAAVDEERDAEAVPPCRATAARSRQGRTGARPDESGDRPGQAVRRRPSSGWSARRDRRPASTARPGRRQRRTSRARRRVRCRGSARPAARRRRSGPAGRRGRGWSTTLPSGSMTAEKPVGAAWSTHAPSRWPAAGRPPAPGSAPGWWCTTTALVGTRSTSPPARMASRARRAKKTS